MIESYVDPSLDNRGKPGQDIAGEVEVSVEAGRGVHYEDQVGREVADHVAGQDGPDGDGQVDLLLSHPPLLLPLTSRACLHRLMPHNRPMNAPDNVDDPEVAVGDDAVREGWDKYSVKVRETVSPASASEDGAGTWSGQLPVILR